MGFEVWKRNNEKVELLAQPMSKATFTRMFMNTMTAAEEDAEGYHVVRNGGGKVLHYTGWWYAKAPFEEHHTKMESRPVPPTPRAAQISMF